MAHAMRLHKNQLANNALEKRVPYPTPVPVPDPGLIGDVVNGVGNIVSNAVSGVVGLVSTVAGDVNALVAPTGTSSSTPAARTSSSSAAQATTASPSATSTPSSGGSNSGSSSGSNGNNGSSNGSSSSSNGNGSSNGSNSNSNGSSSNSDSGSSGGSGSSSSGSQSSNGLNASGTSSASGASSASQSSGVSGSTVPTPTSPSDVINLAHSSADPSETGATAVPVINAVGSIDSEDQSGSTLLSGSRGTTTARNTIHSSSPTGSSGTGSGSGGDGDGNGNGTSSSSNGLSPGIIAAIVVISALALLALIVFFMRRWYRKRRERRLENWASGPGAFASLGAASVKVSNEKHEKSEGSGSGSGTRSARSSFGTTIDRGLRPFTPDPLSQSASNFSDFYTATNTSTTFLSPSPAPAPLVTLPPVQRPENAVDRQSLVSLASSSSSSYGSGGGVRGPGNTSTEAVLEDSGSIDDAQYLIAPAAQSQNSPNAPQPSPISVRPWSPSERWAFPKPPTTTSARSDILYQPPTSSVCQSVDSDRVPASHLPPLTPVTLTGPGSVPEATDPFADPSQAAPVVTAVTGEVTSGTCESAVTAKTSASDSGTDGIVGGVEYIRRPFLPTLADELKVQRGDVVRVLQAFDDGWVQVEKLSSTPESSGAEPAATTAITTTNTTASERGLIPMDCLREDGELLPDFLATRRVSSYYGYGVAM